MRYVYVIRNLINGKVYVGQTKNFANRKAGHFYAARSGLQRPLYHAIRKHGEANFVFEILEECKDELINEREQHWVSHFDSFNPEKGYNLTNGGENGKDVSDETRKKLSLALQGKTKTVEHREKISKARMGWVGLVGEANPTFQKERSLIHSQRISRSLKNNKSSQGTRNGRSKLTEEKVREIKRLLAEGKSVNEVAEKTKMSSSQIYRIKCNKHWSHVTI